MTNTRTVLRATAFYPVTVTYLAGVVGTVAVIQGWLRLDAALIMLGLLAMLVVLRSTHAEVAKVHLLVNSQHDALVNEVGLLRDRVEQLVDALLSAGLEVPHDEAGVDREREPR